MAKSYSIAEARERFSEVVDRAASGTPVRISRRGTPVAVVVAATWFDSHERRPTTFWEGYQAFRKELELTGIDIRPDEVFADVRDKSPGRDVRF